jgi:hypothetical protein
MTTAADLSRLYKAGKKRKILAIVSIYLALIVAIVISV